MLDPLQRYRACLLGLAAGDALGAALELQLPGTFAPLTNMTGGGPHHLQPGQWTDDTSMALCLAESLIESKGFDPIDQLQRYAEWFSKGYLSSTGQCFDIGNTVRGALIEFERERKPWCGPTDPNTAGNGSLMRLAPVPMYFAADPAQAIQFAADSSRTTHGAPQAIDACRYFAALLLGALRGEEKDVLLSAHYSPLPQGWREEPLHPEVSAVAAGSFKNRQPPEVRADGYVVATLEAALWAFDRTSDFKTGALLAVNLGEDADTVGAIYGQLAGAYYGERAIPVLWRHLLSHRYLIEAYATKLFQLS